MAIFSKKRLRPYILGSILPLGIFIVWVIAWKQGLGGPLFVSPAQLFSAVAGIFSDEKIIANLYLSLSRFAAGLLMGSAIGISLGFLIGLSTICRRLLRSTLRVLQQISLFAWIPFLMAWFGLGEGSKFAFISLAAFFPLFINTLEGTGKVSHHLLEVGSVLRLTKVQTIRYVVFPSALPSIFTGGYLSLTYAWLGTLGAEYMMTASDGIGSLLVEGQEMYHMDQVLLGVVTISTMGLILNTLIRRLEKKVIKYEVS